MAAYLAKAGVNCVVFERELMPRPHVGESLVPSAMRVFRDLDFLPRWKKPSFRTSSARRGPRPDQRRLQDGFRADSVSRRFPRGHSFQRAPAGRRDREYTYHVDRSKFDLMLLQHANKLGAAVYEGVKVKEVDFGDPKEPIVRFNMGMKEMGRLAGW